jgi:hypothetical protein
LKKKVARDDKHWQSRLDELRRQAHEDPGRRS